MRGRGRFGPGDQHRVGRGRLVAAIIATAGARRGGCEALLPDAAHGPRQPPGSAATSCRCRHARSRAVCISVARVRFVRASRPSYTGRGGRRRSVLAAGGRTRRRVQDGPSLNSDFPGWWDTDAIEQLPGRVCGHLGRSAVCVGVVFGRRVTMSRRRARGRHSRRECGRRTSQGTPPHRAESARRGPRLGAPRSASDLRTSRREARVDRRDSSEPTTGRRGNATAVWVRSRSSCTSPRPRRTGPLPQGCCRSAARRGCQAGPGRRGS